VKTIKIGMLGCGVVGGSVARELASNSSDLAARAGAKLELTKIAVRSLGSGFAVNYRCGISSNRSGYSISH
jgi:homoserine dehydrogenase